VLLDNLEYDEIKHQIKSNTTPGPGKAVSVPGQGDATKSKFESELYDVFCDQHGRILDFVKFKAGEIERRLGGWEGSTSTDAC